MKHRQVHIAVILLSMFSGFYLSYRTAPAGTSTRTKPVDVDLNRKYDFAAVDRPFSEVLTSLIGRHRLPIIAEVPDNDPKLNIQCKNSPLSTLLNEIARQAKMKWTQSDGYVVFFWQLTPLRSLGVFSRRSTKVEEMLDFWDSLSTAQRSQLSRGLLLYKDLTDEQREKLERLLQRKFPQGFGVDASKDTLTAVRIVFFPGITVQSQGKEISGFAVRTLSGSQRSLLLNPQTGKIAVLPPDEVWFTFKE